MSSSLPASDPGTVPFSIGAVSDMTGIAEATLRVWERRYDFPRAERTPTGRRRYTQQDVLRLLWVRQQMEGGMRASRAIRAQAIMERDATVVATLTETLPPCAAPDQALIAAQSRLLDALLSYDAVRAAAILDEVSGQRPQASVVLNVIGPTLAAVGDTWAAGETGIAAEHFATNFLRHHLLKLMQTAPAPYATPPIVLACAPEELHEGSLLMLGALLREMRWPIIYLGQSLPLADIGALASRALPAMIVFVAMREATALALADWPQIFAPGDEGSASRPPIIGFGGLAFSEHPELIERMPGALLGATLCEGSQRINRLMLHLSVLHNLRE